MTRKIIINVLYRTCKSFDKSFYNKHDISLFLIWGCLVGGGGLGGVVFILLLPHSTDRKCLLIISSST